MLDEFCNSCGIALPKSLLFNKPQGHKFKDGWYCEKCAQIKVENERKKLGSRK